jgi:hypothetical protein
MLEKTMDKMETWAKPPKISKSALAASLKGDKAISSGFDQLKKSKQSTGFKK